MRPGQARPKIDGGRQEVVRARYAVQYCGQLADLVDGDGSEFIGDLGRGVAGEYRAHRAVEVEQDHRASAQGQRVDSHGS
jgi:hypothetical protein